MVWESTSSTRIHVTTWASKLGDLSVLASYGQHSLILTLELIRKPEIVIGENAFEISAIVLPLDVIGAYPLLLGRPWMHNANIGKYRMSSII